MENHCMMEYGFVEATDFEGVMPEIAEKIGTVGASDVVVKMHGMEAKGSDSLEVMDIQAFFNSESEVSEEIVEDEQNEIVDGE